MPELNPVQTHIRDHVVAHYDQWRIRAEEPAPTRAGLRYLGANVATLLAPALDAVGLLVFEEGYETRLFVTSAGKQITRERLGDLIAGALADHPDRVLRASIGTASFWDHIADRMPYYEGEEIERASAREARPAKTNADYARAYRARKAENERASARAYLTALVGKGILTPGERVAAPDLYAGARKNIARKVEEAEQGYGSPIITDEDDSPVWTVPGRTLFYAVADEILGERKRTARGAVYTFVRRIVKRLTAWRKRPLSPETEETLRSIAALVRGLPDEPGEESPRRRLRWRDRPIGEDAANALRGITATVTAEKNEEARS